MLEQVLQYLYKAIARDRWLGARRRPQPRVVIELLPSNCSLALAASLYCVRVIFLSHMRYIQINSAPKIEVLLCLDS
jgi:hypothetical protein